MIDPTQTEIDAMKVAGEFAGQYLDAIGKTDLATLTPEEWVQFIEAVCTGFTDKLGEET